MVRLMALQACYKTSFTEGEKYLNNRVTKHHWKEFSETPISREGDKSPWRWSINWGPVSSFGWAHSLSQPLRSLIQESSNGPFPYSGNSIIYSVVVKHYFPSAYFDSKLERTCIYWLLLFLFVFFSWDKISLETRLTLNSLCARAPQISLNPPTSASQALGLQEQTSRLCSYTLQLTTNLTLMDSKLDNSHHWVPPDLTIYLTMEFSLL